jgi:hypothetical protein
MTYAIQELVVRHVSPFDTAEITELVADAMWDGPVARWLQPDPLARRRNTPRYFEIFVEHAVRYGEVYGTADETGRMAGVALWFPLTSMIPPPLDYDRRVKEASEDAVDRVHQLDAVLDENHPLDPHHYLAFLAVRPSRLDDAGIPAYLEANDPRNRDLYLRHGYQVRSVLQLPGGPPPWAMWREPMV